jgi:hypothetical protein
LIGSTVLDRTNSSMGALRDAHMPADLHVPDAPFLDEPPGEAGSRTEQLGNLVDGQVAVVHVVGSPSVPGAGSRDAASQASPVLRPVPVKTQWARTSVVSPKTVSYMVLGLLTGPSAVMRRYVA